MCIRDRGSATGLSNLGSLYQHGTGVPQDMQKAVQLFTMAAEKGSFPAQRFLAGAYLTGNGVQKDSAQAAKWMQLAAAQGDAETECNLAILYPVSYTHLDVYKRQLFARLRRTAKSGWWD